jgi:hypothetical protein
MAEFGEWTRKGGTLTDVTAQKEYGVTHDFIVEGIRVGKLEYRESSIWGNPTFKILRTQLEHFIAERLGAEYLARGKTETELRTVKGEISAARKKLTALESRKAELEQAMKTLHDR